jgi:hypothetical protein
MSAAVTAGAIGVLLALVCVGVGVAVLLLCDSRAEWLVAAEDGSASARRLRVVQCTLGAALAVLLAFVIACARL